MPSGDVKQIAPGEYAGATDLSEQTFGAGVPLVGWTLRGQHGAGLFTISDGGAEGTIARWGSLIVRTGPVGWTMDGADGLFTFGEILLRKEIINIGNDFQGGIGANIDEDSGSGNIVLANALQLFRTTGGSSDLYGMQLDPRVDQGAAVIQVYVEPARPYWHWMRLRLSDAGSGNTRWQAKAWLGALSAEPVGWALDFNPGSSPGIQLADLIGFVGEVNGASDNFAMGMAYFSFSTNVAITGAPGTVQELDDLPEILNIDTPVLTVDPLQDTWVGLQATPFSLS